MNITCKLAEAAPGEAGEALPTATHTAGFTAEGKIVGTAAYMSPDQAEGKPVDVRSDVFSFGIVMYEMATGQQPFNGDTAISTITSILGDTPVSIGELKLEMPRHLGRVVSRCLAKEPDLRDQGTRRAGWRSQPVQIHALMGRKDEALKALRRAIDDGFRPGSKPFLLDPTVDSLRDDPRFIAMVKEITVDVDRMRQALAASGK